MEEKLEIKNCKGCTDSSKINVRSNIYNNGFSYYVICDSCKKSVYSPQVMYNKVRSVNLDLDLIKRAILQWNNENNN